MTSKSPSPVRRAALLSVALLGTGCAGSLLPKPAAAPARYTLGDAAALPGVSTASSAPALQPNVLKDALKDAPKYAPSIVVALPNAAPGFDSTRMVYLRQPQALQFYAYAEWVDTPARLLLPLLVQAVQQTGAFRAVLQAPSSATGALRLETELLRLQHDHTASPSEVRLTLRAVLLDTATRQPLGTREFDARVPAPSDDPAGCVAAAATASRRVLAELANYAATFASGTRREP